MMTTQKLITSGKKDQIRRLVEVAAGNATLAALDQLSLDDTIAQTCVIENGNELQKLVLSEITSAVTNALNKLSGRKHPSAEDLELYFSQVYGLKIDITGVQFPERNGMPCYMAVPTGLDEDQIMSRLAKYFKVKLYLWNDPIAKNIDRSVEQKRPSGLYVFAHIGGDEPDVQHLGKSYDDVVLQGLTFLNAREYLLVTGFHMWKYKKWMDVRGWTRTSSLWLDGRLARGGLRPHNTKLYLNNGNRDNRSPGSGFRELFLG